MKTINKILIGSLIGGLAIFILPIFPVFVPAFENPELKRVWWVNGKYFFDILKFAWKDFLFIEVFGATMGGLFSFIE